MPRDRTLAVLAILGIGLLYIFPMVKAVLQIPKNQQGLRCEYRLGSNHCPKDNGLRCGLGLVFLKSFDGNASISIQANLYLGQLSSYRGLSAAACPPKSPLFAHYLKSILS